MAHASVNTIDSHLRGRENNFNLIRFLAAMAVIVSHSPGVLLGYEAPEPLEDSTGYTLGYHAVNVFFTLSGFLIAKSLITRNDLAAFFAARTLRLIPGLLLATLVTAFVFGPLFTTLGFWEYFSNWSVWTYAPIMGSLVTSELELPGLYTTLAIAGNVNEPLWTLRYEAVMYVGLAAIFSLGMLAGVRRFLIFALLGLAGYAAIIWFTDLREIITP
ncbi:MAG: acyltransferase family protein, partial [Alphaproteobacteria bacterium]